MRSHIESLAANKEFVDYVNVIHISMIFIMVFIMQYHVLRNCWGWAGPGGKDEYCPVTYVRIIVDFLLTPEKQMLPKYHQRSRVNMKKKKYSVLVLYYKRMIYSIVKFF